MYIIQCTNLNSFHPLTYFTIEKFQILERKVAILAQGPVTINFFLRIWFDFWLYIAHHVPFKGKHRIGWLWLWVTLLYIAHHVPLYQNIELDDFDIGWLWHWVNSPLGDFKIGWVGHWVISKLGDLGRDRWGYGNGTRAMGCSINLNWD